MNLAQWFVVVLIALQWSAAVVYASHRKWGEAVIMLGAGVANIGVIFLGRKP